MPFLHPSLLLFFKFLASFPLIVIACAFLYEDIAKSNLLSSVYVFFRGRHLALNYQLLLSPLGRKTSPTSSFTQLPAVLCARLRLGVFPPPALRTQWCQPGSAHKWVAMLSNSSLIELETCSTSRILCLVLEA